MPRVAWAPPPGLAPFCVELWGIQRDFGRGHAFPLTPDAYVELMVHRGELQVEQSGVVRRLPSACVVGLLEAPVTVRGRGPVAVFAARIHGFAAALFFGRPMVGIVEGWPGLEAEELVEAVEQGGLEGMEGRWERALAPRTRVARELWPGAEAARRIAAGAGNVRVKGLAEVLRRSRRQVERDVRGSAGVSPKRLAQLQRFQTLRDALWAEPSAPLADLAAGAGYADQAHATRDFRARSGYSLRAFRRALRSMTEWAERQDGAFVQESGRPSPVRLPR